MKSETNKALEDIARGIPTDPWCPQMEPCDQARQDELDNERQKQDWWQQQDQDDDYISNACEEMS